MTSTECVVVTGKNPEGSVAEDTDYIRCGLPVEGLVDGWPMCEHHVIQFTQEIAV